MDVVTQCVLGASAAQVFMGRKLPRSAWLAGALGGYVPDADIFIRPPGDALGGLLWHRHFTHGLGFIPIGAVLATIPFLLFPAGRRAYGRLLLAALLGVATHAPLDACTSYGTCLWWPFSDARVSWDLIGIIDPLVTLPLLVTVIWSAVLTCRERHDLQRAVSLEAPAHLPTRRRTVAAMGFVWAWFYIVAVGGLMNLRAQGAVEELARSRGHASPQGLRVMPQPVSLLLWRSVYIHDGRIWSDAVHTLPLRSVRVIPGRPQPLLPLETAQGLTHAEFARTAVAGFYWFTDGYVSPDPANPSFLGDMRYGIDPERFSCMWGLRLPPPGEPEGRLLFGRPNSRAARTALLWDQLILRDPRWITLEKATAGVAPR